MPTRRDSASPGRSGGAATLELPVHHANREALARRHPGLLRQLLDAPGPGPGVATPTALAAGSGSGEGPAWGTGPATRRATAPPGGDPSLPPLPPDLSEAEEILVFGFGDGSLPAAVLADAAPAARVTVAVLDPGRCLAALAARDLAALLADPRLRLAAGGLRDLAAALPRRPGERFRVVADPAALGAAPPELAPIAQMARELAAAQRSLLGQRRVVLANVAANLPAIARAEPAAALLPAVAGRPALLVAPGPSLADDLELLRARRGDLPLLVALDAALRPLSEAGVPPDLVVTLDPNPRNLGKFLPRGTDAAAAVGAGPGDAPWLHRALPLLFFEGARPEAVAAAGRPFFACEQDGLLDRAHPAFGRAGTYRSGGTVLLAALDVLLRLGAGPVGLLGADLALAEGGAYGPGGEAAGAARGRVLEVPARGGGTVRTTESLWRHRRRLLRRLEGEPPDRVVDLARRGAELPGVPRADLAAWLERVVPGAALRGPGPRVAPATPPDAVPVLPADVREAALAAAREALAAAGVPSEAGGPARQTPPQA